MDASARKPYILHLLRKHLMKYDARAAQGNFTRGGVNHGAGNLGGVPFGVNASALKPGFVLGIGVHRPDEFQRL